MNYGDKVIDWLVKGEGEMPDLYEPLPKVKEPIKGKNYFQTKTPRLTSTTQIRVLDQSADSILIEVLSGDDLLTPEERAAIYYAHDNHEDEEDE